MHIARFLLKLQNFILVAKEAFRPSATIHNIILTANLNKGFAFIKNIALKILLNINDPCVIGEFVDRLVYVTVLCPKFANFLAFNFN